LITDVRAIFGHNALLPLMGSAPLELPGLILI
jgi:hypothetical protein